MKLEAVTVCVNYADYLALSWTFNQRFFKRLVVVTDLRDEATPKLCAIWPGLECVRTDAFYDEGTPFAKSRGLNLGLERLSDGPVVSLDADIVIGNFRGVLEAMALAERCGDPPIPPGIIFGPKTKYHVQRQEAGSNLHGGGTACAGFFQLFTKVPGLRFPEGSADCSHDDIAFCAQFKQVRYLPLPAYHLGPSMPDGVPNVNWQGRRSPPCPLSVGDVANCIMEIEPSSTRAD